MSKVRVEFNGNLGKEPEVRLVGEIKVAKFNVAVTSRYKNKNGEYEDETIWMSVEAWRGLAEIAEKFLKKGSKISVWGTLKNNNYTSKDGETKSFQYVLANDIEILNKIASDDDNKDGTSNNPFQESEGVASQGDELPF